jgi:hypothetical protein
MTSTDPAAPTPAEAPGEPNRPDAAGADEARARRLSLLVWAIARGIGLTLRIRYENFERIEAVLGSGNGGTLVTWHGRTLIPANVFRNRRYWALISLSRDGEVQDHIFRRFGYQTIRGSTGRGGVRAALQLARKIGEGGVLAFTPDGPRGPSHKVQQGTIFLAQRSGKPILPLGISARPRVLIGTWDRYMVPCPFARAAFVVGEPMYVAPDLDDAGKLRAAEALERAINRCERRAEEMLGLPYPPEWPTEPPDAA